MKKIKKILAAVMTLAMVLGMSMTSFAAEKGKVTVNNLDDNAKVYYVQLITEAPTKETGWGLTAAGMTAFSATEDTEQTLIKSLILYANPNNAALQEKWKDITPATASDIEAALGKVSYLTQTALTPTNGSVNFEVETGGMFAIQAVSTDDAYTYGPMAAYVGLLYDESGNAAGYSDNVTVNAKTTKTPTEKSHGNEQDVTAIGKTVDYQIETKIPYVADSVSQQANYYTVTDTIYGAKYVENSANHVTLTIKVGDSKEVTKEVEFQAVPGEEDVYTFTVDLSDYAFNRENANKTLVIKYQATVKTMMVSNEVVPTLGDHKFDSEWDYVNAAGVKLTKVNEEGDRLNGAVFILKDETNEEWAICEEVYEDNVFTGYMVTGWTKEKNKATSLETQTIAVGYDYEENQPIIEKGCILVGGLDSDYKYSFEEVEAPEGYSKDTDAADVTWSTTSTYEAVQIPLGTAEKVNTTLSSLPETGGIGTTIFTIGGCIIMIAAAGLFFASRRKSSK